ncbi:MAG: Ldh family oxidoreductase [Bacteroidota bacterium]|nr:Ldh family oxidoreductase [Bacteroidota bacterium]
MRYSKHQLHTFTSSVFIKCGMSREDALQAADVLLASDLRGIDSHGVARLVGYIRLWEAGRANMQPAHKIIHETPSTATLDADAGLGLVIAPKAMQIAIEKAKNVGTGWVAIQNSNHFGIAAYHAMLALPHDMIGISMTNASPLVAPTFSKERMLGTNPICIAVPAQKHQPFILDMATSNAANGKLEIAQRVNKPVPPGWVQTATGKESTDANEVKNGGSLMPLGGHKGYGLGAAVDILSAVLSGANYGPWVPPFVTFLNPLDELPGKGIGHFVGAMRIDAFRPADEFKKHMDNWISRFKNAERIDPDQEVLIPGEPEYRMMLERDTNGIPLNDKVVKDLQDLGKKFDIQL